MCISAASDPFKGVFGSMDMSSAMVPGAAGPGGTTGPAPLALDVLLGPNHGGFPKQPSAQGELQTRCSEALFVIMSLAQISISTYIPAAQDERRPCSCTDRLFIGGINFKPQAWSSSLGLADVPLLKPD